MVQCWIEDKGGGEDKYFKSGIPMTIPLLFTESILQHTVTVVSA